MAELSGFDQDPVVSIVYEITAAVPPEAARQYESYMRSHHIPDILTTGCFTGASLERSEPGRYRARYMAADRESLDRYLAEHAPRLRADGERRFPPGVSVVREEWEVLQSWGSRRC
jgi:hypothetical protein